MSHFVVMVIGDDAEKQLEKYDESLELPPYIKHTKDELVALKRKEIEEDFLNFPAGTLKIDVWHWFDERCPNNLHDDLMYFKNDAV